jgi:hypothetical protein
MQFASRFLVLILTAGSFATDLRSQADSRLAEIALQQEEKAASAQADTVGKVERAMLEFRERSLLQRFSAGIGGLHLKLGGLGPGTGFGVGPEYRRGGLMGGQLDVRGAAQSSFNGDRRFELELSAPRLAAGRRFAKLYAVRHNYSRMQYYGSGPDSQKSGRTDYRLEDTAVDATFGVRPLKRLTLASTAGYLWNNIGPGVDPRFASADLVYTPAQAPGIDRQSNFTRSGAYAHYDWRDNPDGPRRGGSYFAQFSDFRDRTLGASDFQRLDLEAQQYVSILNDRRVFAVRAKTTLTYADRTLPFYMQPSLGGGDDLRGFRPYRFRGDNSAVVNAEYRWEIFSGLDMAVFGDAGQVFTRKSDFAWSRMQTDVGFGFRFNERDRTFLRLDVGFSHEGFQVWVKFANVFKKGPVHTSSIMGDI